MAEFFEEANLDTLQNIEITIVDFSRDHPELLDYDVEGVLDTLIAAYSAERRGRTVQERRLPGLRQPLADEVRETCEWLLGRSEPEDGLHPEPIPLGTVITCLNKLRKSVRRWNREAGRQGYIHFVQQYVL